MRTARALERRQPTARCRAGRGWARRATAGVLVAGFVMAGCGDDGSEEAGEEPRSEVSVQDGSATTGAPRSRADLPKPVEPDLELRHPNGTVVRVQRVSFAPTSISVDVEAVNGFTKNIALNQRGVHLADDLGNGYNFVAPQDNTKLVVASGATLTGTLSFLGPIDRKATSLKLLINTYDHDDSVELAKEYDRTENPSFEFPPIRIRG